ncbi:MAG: GAF domain-containing protein, partial [Anaerolineae bacterium]|nr:GAF domain-containing protein [Anaerolineae bacterium]
MSAEHTILIVDDDPLTRKTLSDILQAKGYIPIAVATGGAALDRIETPTPAVALIDLNLEDMSGLALLAEVKRGFPDIECIVITGHASQASAIEAVNLGAYGYLQKPYAMEQLLVTVRRAIEKRETEQALRESEQRFRSLFETMAEGVILIAPDGQVVQSNVAAERMLGLTRSEIEARSYGAPEWETLRSDGTPMPPEEMACPRALAEGQPVKDVVMGVKRPDGSSCWMSVSAAPLVGPTGGLEGVVGTFVDITERRQAEREIRRQAARAEALARTAERLNAQLDLDAVLDAVCQETAHALDVPIASVYLVDQQRRVLYCASGLGLPRDRVAHPPVVPLHAFDEHFRSMGPLIVVPDVRAAPGLPGTEHWAGLDIRSHVSAVLQREGVLVGALNAAAVGEVRHFTDDELTLLQGLADQATQAIENARLFQEVRQRLDQLTLLFETSTALAGSLEVDSVLRVVAKRIATAMNVDGCAVSRWDQEQDAVVTLLDRTRALDLGWWEPDTSGTTYPLRDYPATRRVLTDHQPLALQANDPDADPAERAWMQAKGIRTQLMVPLVVGDQAIGLLALMECQKERTFTKGEIALCQTLANQAAAALENARLFEETCLRADRLATLHRLGTKLNSALDLRTVLDTLYAEIKCIVDTGAFYVALFDETTGRIDFPLLADKDGPQHIEPLDIARRPGITGYVIQSQKPLYVPDTWEAMTARRAPYDIIPLADQPARSYIGVPLSTREKVIGVLSVQSYEPNAYTDSDVQLLTTVASQAATAIENARLYDDARRRNRELALLNRVIAASAVARDIESVLETVCRELALAFDVPQSAAALLNEEKTEAMVVAEHLAKGRP